MVRATDRARTSMPAAGQLSIRPPGRSRCRRRRRCSLARFLCRAGEPRICPTGGKPASEPDDATTRPIGRPGSDEPCLLDQPTTRSGTREGVRGARGSDAPDACFFRHRAGLAGVGARTPDEGGITAESSHWTGVGEPLLGVDVHGPRTGGVAPGGPYSRTFWSSPSVGPVRSHAARPP